MSQPTVSVIVPLYNSEAFILHTLESIRKQTFQDFEVIIINDGSTDSGSDLVRHYIHEHSLADHWCLIPQTNRGLAGARNSGIRVAEGEYIAFLDADDLWHPEKLEKHIAHLRSNHSVGVSYSRCEFMNEDGLLTSTYTNPRLKDIKLVDILTDNPLCNGSNGLFTAEIFEAISFPSEKEGRMNCEYFDEDLRRCEDLDAWLRMFIKASVKFEGIPEVLVYYRNNAGGLSADLSKQEIAKEQVLNKLNTYAPNVYAKYHKLARASLYRYLARRAVRFGDKDLALLYSLKLLKTKSSLLLKLRTLKTMLGVVCVNIGLKVG